MVPEGKVLESVFTLLVAVDQHRSSLMGDAGPLSAGNPYMVNLEMDLQSLFGLLCTAVLAETPHSPPPPLPPHLGSYTRALLVRHDRRHLFVTSEVTIHWCDEAKLGLKNILKL
jgi:hypothetical protein